MPRRQRRSGIRYIEDKRDRGLTFFKRREGLSKTAADLSTLTGARTAVMLESENGKMSAFGTPLVDPIIDSFLLGNAPPLVNEENRATITHLQNDLFHLEKHKAMEDKRAKASMARKKEVQETSRLAKHIYGDEKDLDVDELNELLDGLTQVQRDINDQIHALHPGCQLEIGGARDPSLRLSSPWSQPQIQLLPRHFPWTPLESSSHLKQSSWPLPQLSKSQSSLLNPVMLPSPQAPTAQLPQHQAHMMSLSTESHQCNYHLSQHSSRSTLLSSDPPQPTANFNPMVLSQNHTNSAGSPFANYQWPPIIPSNEPYYDRSLHGHNVYLGNNGYYGGQAAGANDMLGPSGLHQQAYDRIDMTLFEFSTGGESISGSDGGEEDSHGDMSPYGAN